MGPVPYASTSDIDDGLLAVAGCRVRSSDLRHVAERLEHVESANITFGHDDVYYNPSDIATWVDSLGSASADPGFAPSPWTDQTVTATTMTSSEDSAILLVHLLMTCAGHVERGETALAADAIKEMRVQLLTSVGTGFGIGKVAGYFLDALHRRLYSVPPPATTATAEDEFLYHHFYESSPYIKFAHFTANQAILEAFDGADRVHVVDLGLMQGLQWPALIQAFALRPGGPPSVLRLTGVGPPSPDGRDSLRETGVKLAELARTLGVRFSFMGIAATRLEDVKPWMLNVSAGEAVAVNSIFQLHKLLREPDKPGHAHAVVDSVLAWIAGLKPRIVTVVEQEADHNKQSFVDRFTEALFYYSAMFDSLEGAGGAPESAAVAEVYLQREICNIICCEGLARVERHEPVGKWRGRLGQAGLRQVHLGSNAFKQASMLLTLFSGEGYCVEELDGCLELGWHGRPMISASAWRGDDDGSSMSRSRSLSTNVL